MLVHFFQKKIDLSIVIGKIMKDGAKRKLRAELKQLYEKSKHPVKLNNYQKKKLF